MIQGHTEPRPRRRCHQTFIEEYYSVMRPYRSNFISQSFEFGLELLRFEH